MRARTLYTVGLLFLLAFAAYPLYQMARTNYRLSQAARFPEQGFLNEHPFLAMQATIYIVRDEAQEVLRLVPEITVYNNSNSYLKGAVAAAQLPSGVSSFVELGNTTVQMHAPVDIRQGPPQPSLSFSLSMRLLPQTAETILQLEEVLQEPMRVQLIHDGGTELLLIYPTVVNRVKR